MRRPAPPIGSAKNGSASSRSAKGRSKTQIAAGKLTAKQHKQQAKANKKAKAKRLAQNKARMAHPKMQSRRKTLSRQYRFDRAIRAALTSGGPANLEPQWVTDILAGFGDTSLSAEDPYVTAVLTSAATIEGPILQCGAGPMTLLLALVMQRRSDYLWTLEHNPSWAQCLRSLMARYDIRSGNLLQAPAEAFGDHIWYVLDTKQLPREFGLVLCDASNVLPTGLRGVVRRLDKQLSQRCVLLVRNSTRPKDLDFASKWAKQRNAPFILNDKGDPFVKIALRNEAKEAQLAGDRALTIYDGVSEPTDLFAGQRSPGQLAPVSRA